jgi:oxygen-independent coproporphyrinogen-3 oxidase
VGATFNQNVKTLDEYYDLLNQGRLPIARGLALTRDDLVRRTVIMALMCQGSVLFESVEVSHLIQFQSYFANELHTLREMQAEGLVIMDDSGIHVTELGWFFVRGVAMVFDKYLQADRNRARFSKII